MNAHANSLEAFKAARRQKAADLAGIMEARERLQAAEGEEASILAMIGALGASEVQAMREWAMSDRDGEPPMCDAAERTRLNERLVQAQAQAQAAKGAVIDLDAEQIRLASEIIALGEKIEFVAIDTLLADHHASHTDLLEYAASVRARVAETFSIHLAMIQRANVVNDQSPALAQAYRRAAEKIAGASRPVFDATQQDVFEALPKWVTRFNELMTAN